jgi:p-aminobenzoyl-glutamate transporter AbgT
MAPASWSLHASKNPRCAICATVQPAKTTKYRGMPQAIAKPVHSSMRVFTVHSINTRSAAMFQLVSPLSKVMVLTLSVGLTWSTLGTMTESFRHATDPAQQVVQLPLVVVVGHRSDLLAPSAPVAQVQELPAGAKLTKMNADKNPAI